MRAAAFTTSQATALAGALAAHQVEVDPRYTSQACAECGTIDRSNRLDQATFACVACGHTDNADTNAARNIHQARALAVEPPKRTLRRVGKRKQLRETVDVAA
jgi:transposase